MRPAWKMALVLAGMGMVVGLNRGADPEPQPVAKRDPAPVASGIDREVVKKLAEEKIPASALAGDGEFIRRAYLDITGKIPPVDKVRAFLEDKDPQKRAKLIDELLASPDYGRHFSIIWSDLVVKRDDMNRGLPTAEFKKWLAEGFNTGRGWHELVSDMLTAAGDTKVPQITFFLANRDMGAIAPAKVVDSITILFMGNQLQCAECHKHPFTKNWKQEDFWGIAAFFAQTRVEGANRQQQNNLSTVSIVEGGTPGGGGRPGGFGFGRPTLKGAEIAIPDPIDPRRSTGKTAKARFFEDEAQPKLDKAPYRPAFAQWLTAKENKYFARAMVNRMWGHFFARGFVNPIDDLQPDNPASHPEILDSLAKEFADSNFDIKHLVRCICTSQTYQRTSQPVKGNEHDEALFSHMKVKVMGPEVLYDSLMLAMGVSEAPAAPRPAPPMGGGGFRGGFGSPREQFVSFFTTKEPGDDPAEFAYGIPQFLRLINSPQFNRGGAVIDRLMKADASKEKVIEGLYLSVLARKPADDEMKKMLEYVNKKDSPKTGYDGVLWVLLNSAEFVCIR